MVMSMETTETDRGGAVGIHVWRELGRTGLEREINRDWRGRERSFEPEREEMSSYTGNLPE